MKGWWHMMKLRNRQNCSEVLLGSWIGLFVMPTLASQGHLDNCMITICKYNIFTSLANLNPLQTKGKLLIRLGLVTYGWRKCSKSQVRRIATEVSGSPLIGLQAPCLWPWIIRSCWRDILFSLHSRSYKLSCANPLLTFGKSCINFRFSAFMCDIIASLKLPKCLDIALRARAV